MQIGLDLRFVNNDLYSDFVIELSRNLTNTDKENQYTIYVNHTLQIPGADNQNTQVKKVSIENGTSREQLQFSKILKQDRNNIMIFFNHYKPLMYKGEYYIIVSSLKDVYYVNSTSLIDKYKNLYLLEKNLRNASKTICFDENTQNELTERFNIKEEKITLLPGFFPNHISKNNKEAEIKIDIKTKYQIENDFFIYSGGDGIEKNLEKLIFVFEKLKEKKKLSLIFIGDSVGKNIALRNLVVQYKIQDRIKFLGKVSESEKKFLYKQARGVVFPSLYETFPFHLGESLYYNAPILASNLKSIKKICGGTIQYFSPISKSSIGESIDSFINTKEIKVNYSEIKDTYTCDNTVENLLKIIK